MRHFIKNARWVAAVIVLLAVPAVSQVQKSVTFSVSDQTSQYVTEEGQQFLQLSAAGCDHVPQTGAPMLPVRYLRLSVPYNATDITVSATATSMTPVRIPCRVYPVPVPVTTCDSLPCGPTLVLDSAIYMTNAYWPPAAAELVSEGFFMGENRVVTVAVYPAQYNPMQNRVRTNTQVNVTVSYNTGGVPTNMLIRYDSQLRQLERQQVMALVDNPTQVSAFAVPQATAQHIQQLNNPNPNYNPVPGYEYMVITTQELKPAFKRLVALKQQKGYRAGVVCVEDIVTDSIVQNGDYAELSNGTISNICDNAAKIRKYLKESLPYGLKNVMMGGRTTPFRYAGIRKYNDHDTPTDWYYADLTSKWIIYPKDSIEYYQPKAIDGFELSVGRLMADSIVEIMNYTRKLFKYELNPGNGNTSYLQRCLVVEGSEFNTDFSDGTYIANAYSPTFSDTTLIIQSGHDYPTGNQLINLINSNNYALLSLHGHGCPYTIAVNNWNKTNYTKDYQRIASLNKLDTEFDDNGFDLLVNKEYPSIFYSWSCTNAPFDIFYEPYLDKYYTDWNLAQSFLIGKDYGGVAFLGNTRVGYYSSSKNPKYQEDLSPLLEKEFASALGKGYHQIGKTENMSKMLYSGSSKKYLTLTHNLHGDPEFSIWTAIPQQYQGIAIQRGNNSLTVNGINSENAIVGLSDGVSQKMDSTSTGSVTFTDVNPNSTVMVYQHNYLPYIAPLYLQNEYVQRSQYVIANDVFAGKAVDSGRTAGELTIAAGSEYEIETKGTVTLAPGFKVEQGALFSVTKSDY